MSVFRVRILMIEPKGTAGLTTRNPILDINGGFSTGLDALISRCKGGGGCLKIDEVELVPGLPTETDYFSTMPAGRDTEYRTKDAVVKRIKEILEDIKSDIRFDNPGRSYLEEHPEVFQFVC